MSSTAIVAAATPVAAAGEVDVNVELIPLPTSFEIGSQGVGSEARVTNYGTETALNVTVVIDVSPEVNGATPPDCILDAGTIVCPLGDIESGGSRRVYVDFDVPFDANLGPASVLFSATTDSVQDPNEHPDEAVHEFTIIDTPEPTDVRVSQSPSSMIVGVDGYFELYLENQGAGVAVDVVMFDYFDEVFEVVSVSDADDPSACSVDSQRVTCTYSSLEPGESRSPLVHVIPRYVEELFTNSVYVGPGCCVSGGTFWDVNESFVSISPSEADVGVSIADMTGTHTVGQMSEFRVSVNNGGPQLAHDLAFAVFFDDSLSLAINGCAHFQYIGTEIAYCEIDDLAAGATVNFDVFVTPSAAMTAVELSATVSTESIDEIPDNDTASLTFDVENGVPPNFDADADGILDVVDADDGTGASPGSFGDANVNGTIMSVPAGWSVLVSDAPAPDGVRIEVEGGGTERVTVSVCGFTLKLSAGSDVVLTCGSVVIDVAAGTVEVELAGGLAVVTMQAGASAVIEMGSSGRYTVDVTAGSVTVSVDGVVTTIDADDDIATIRAWDFVGFDQPVDGGSTINSVKAGRAVPLKWRLLDEFGAPVLDLMSVKLTFLRAPCDGSGVDVVEQTLSVGSGLQNMGGGKYQLNWKTPSTKGCGTLQLDVGDGVLHIAKFRIT